MNRLGRYGILVYAVLLAPLSATAQAPAEPSDYRFDDYRAPTPLTLRGAVVVDTIAVEKLLQARQTVFIDVLAHAPKPSGLPAGTLWQDPPHTTIAGAVWLPDVGRGALAPETEDYFKRGLTELTSGSFDRPVLFFCKKDCWMSWNAAKRALSYGYRKVYWYSEGIDGWTSAGLPTEVVQPRP